MKTTEEQRAELRRKQQAATPGPWRMTGTPEKPCPVVSATHSSKGYQVHSMLHVKQSEPDVWPNMRETYCRDAAFIAAANPETVGALLDDVDELRERVRALEEIAESHRQDTVLLRAVVENTKREAREMADRAAESERESARKRIVELERQLEDERAEVALKQAALVGTWEENARLKAKSEQRRDVLARWKSGEMMTRPDVWTITNAALED